MKARNMPAGRVALTAAALILTLVLVPAALAGKPSSGGKGGGGSGGTTSGSSSIGGPVMVADTGTPGLSWGDVVTFNLSTTATSQPYVNLKCSQNGVLVANGWKGFFAGSLDSNWNFGLSSGAWTSGAADCTAYLDKATSKGWSTVASLSFHVGA